MQLKNKNVVVVIGPSRAGKGTLLAALMGFKMRKFKRRDLVENFGFPDDIDQKNVIMAADE